MNKKLGLSVIGIGIALSAMAIPAKQGIRTIKQPDGTTISIGVVGDERAHSEVTLDGLSVMRQSDGFYYYRTNDGISAMRASDPERRSEVEKAFVESNCNATDPLRVRETTLRNTNRHHTAALRGAGTQVPNQGSPRIPVLLLQYKDKKFKDSNPKAVFEAQCSSGEKSAYQYFADQSNGEFTPIFDVYGPYTLSGNRIVYGGNDSAGYDVGTGNMVAEGCKGIDSQVDFSKYDNDGDGVCDVMIVIYAGDGEASSFEDDYRDAVWPCQWSLSSSEYGRALRLDNTTIDKFAVFNELNGSDLSKIDGVGTFCHEFSHCLGLPDFYDTQYGPHFGMGSWSLMDYGSYNDDGYTPCGYTAYEKNFMGWLDIEEGAKNTYYTLPIFNSGSKETDKAVKLSNDKNKNEYFVIENRALQGWDKYMPAQGLLIYHVTYESSAWDRNIVNDNDLQLMTPVPADNELKMILSGDYYQLDAVNMKGDLWPYGSAKDFTDSSTPAAKLSYGGYLGKPVTEMKKNSDGTISFWVMKGFKAPVKNPTDANHQINSPTEVTFNWTAGGEEEVTYTLEVKEKVENEVKSLLSANFKEDRPDWTTTGYVSLEESAGGTRLGSGKQNGTVTSPSFKVEDRGSLSVVVNAKYYNNDKSQMRVSLLDNTGESLMSKTVALEASYSDQVVVFSNVQTGIIKIKIETLVSGKRIYVAQVDVYSGEYQSAVRSIRAASDETDYRIIEGITDTTHTLSDLKSSTVYTYRVKAVPVDPVLYEESEWSPAQTVDLSDMGFLTEVVDLTYPSAESEYYTLQGMKISKINAPGIYIVKRGGETRKIIVK